MADVVLPDFPASLLARVDAYVRLLEKLNPGYKWSRTACIASLVSRALAEIEGAELRHSRRRGSDRRTEARGADRRQPPPDRRGGTQRRKPPYPEMVDLVIEHLLREKHGIEDETWRDRHESDPEAG